MAKITKSDAAPSDATHFSFGAVEFDLKTAKSSFDTEDPAVIAGASVHPWLAVEQDVPADDTTTAATDPLDPRANPTTDHLSALASPESISAAEANDAAIRKAVGLDDRRLTGESAPDNPTISDTLQATLDTVNSDASPVLAEPVPAPEPTQPGGGVAPDEAPAASTTPDDQKAGS